jgi:AcrR family transcriptional regulator
MIAAMDAKLRRREDLLRAARTVFATKGYHAAKVEDIAAAAKVAKGTVYLYFRDKRSIFQEILDRVFILLGGAILRVDVHSDVASQVKHNIRAIAGVFLDDPTLPQLLLQSGSGVDQDFQTKVQAFTASARDMLVRAFENGQRLGIVAPGDPHLFALFTIGATREVLLDMATTRRTREEIVDALYKVLSVGFLRVGEKVDDQPVIKKRRG